MVKENQLVAGQLGQSAQHADSSREELRRLQTDHGVLQQTIKARELELEDLRTAYEELAGESRHHQSGVGQMQRQLQGAHVELEAAKQEVAHLQVRRSGMCSRLCSISTLHGVDRCAALPPQCMRTSGSTAGVITKCALGMSTKLMGCRRRSTARSCRCSNMWLTSKL